MRALEEVLKGYSPAGLQALAQAAGVARGGAQRDLPGPTARALLKPGRLKAGVQALTEVERGFLRFAGRLGGTVGAAQADWWLRRHGVPDPIRVLGRLVGRGLAFPPGREADRGVDIAPGGLSAGLLCPEPIVRLAGGEAPEPLATAPEPAKVEGAALPDTLRELFILLRFLTTKPPRGVTTTRHLAQPDLGELAIALGRAGGGRRSRRLEEEPELLWLESLALQAELIEVRDRRLGAADSAETIFTLPTLEQLRTLLEAAVTQTGWGELEASAEISLAHAAALRPGETDVSSPGARIRARRRVLEGLREAARPGEWHRMADLTERLMESGPDFLVRRRLPDRVGAPDSQEPVYRGIRRIVPGDPESLGMVTGWQWVEGIFVAEFLRGSLRRVGLVDTSADRFRVTPLGAQALEMAPESPTPEAPPTRFYVQPNFEIIAEGSGENLAGVVRLARIAELESVDRAALLRLTRDSVCRALDDGLTEAEILDILGDNGRPPVPQNVAFSVREWIAAYQRFQIRTEAWIVDTDRPDELSALERELPGCFERLGPTTARVLPEHRAGVEAALAAREDVVVVDHSAGLCAAFDLDDELRLTPDPSRWHWHLAHVVAQIAESDRGRGGGYRLTPVSIRSALEHGLTAGEIEAFVTQCAKQPLSAKQAFLLRGWLGRYEPVALAPVVVLRVPAEARPDLLAVPEIREAVIGALGPSAFLVKREAAPGVRRLLERAGLTVRGEVGAEPVAGTVGGEPATPSAAFEGAWGRRRWRSGDPEEEKAALLQQAIDQRQRIRITYRPVIKGEVAQEWELSPERLETTRWGLSRLQAFCHRRGEPRVFDLVRIDGIVLLDEPTS